MSNPETVANVFIALGGLLILGLGMQWLGHRFAVPRVTLLIALGILVGPTGFDLISDITQSTFPWISHIALAIVGFLLGGKLHLRFLEKHGRDMLSTSLWITLATWAVVVVACGALFSNWPLALMLGAVATATDPAATKDVIEQSKQDNQLTALLLGIVALDDVWGLIIFSFSVVAASLLTDVSGHHALLSLWELLGAVLLGGAIGLPVAWVTGRSKNGEPLLIEALGAVLLCAGLAEWLQVSYLLACMTMGAMVTNTAKHHQRPFHAIHQIEWPFMMLFFILAGASLDLRYVVQLGWLGVIYILSRILGRLVGGAICAQRQHWPVQEGLLLGQSMLPQAGVAIGIALIASQAFVELGNQLLAIAIGATVIFEIVGPPLTNWSVHKTQIKNGE